MALTYKPFRSPLEELFEVKRQPAPFFDLSIWQNKAFCVYTAAVALFMLGYFIPYVHLVGSPHSFIRIPLGTPIILFPPFPWEHPSICLLHPGSSHLRHLGQPCSTFSLGTAISSLPQKNSLALVVYFPIVDHVRILWLEKSCFQIFKSRMYMNE